MIEPNILKILLIGAAVGQLVLTLLNLRLDKLLHWGSELKNLSLLLREVFYVHKWFISITMAIFGVVTLKFAGEMSEGVIPMGRWLAVGIGLFWAIRTVIQWAYYSKSHWIGKAGPTAVHWILTICYGGCAATYLYAGLAA